MFGRGGCYFRGLPTAVSSLVSYEFHIFFCIMDNVWFYMYSVYTYIHNVYGKIGHKESENGTHKNSNDLIHTNEK